MHWKAPLALGSAKPPDASMRPFPTTWIWSRTASPSIKAVRITRDDMPGQVKLRHIELDGHDVPLPEMLERDVHQRRLSMAQHSRVAGVAPCLEPRGWP